MRKTNEGHSPVSILLIPAAIGFVLTMCLMLIGAVFVQKGTLGENLISVLAIVFLAIGSAVSAFLASRRADSSKLLWAVGSSLLVFLILLVGGALLLHQPVHISRTAISLSVVIVVSIIGSVVGANVRKKSKYRHKK